MEFVYIFYEFKKKNTRKKMQFAVTYYEFNKILVEFNCGLTPTEHSFAYK